jgi:hypothetical protein
MRTLASFGTVGDGVTDDTVAVHAAFAFAEANGDAISVGQGRFRVTSGYTTTRAYSTVRLIGETIESEAIAGNVGLVSELYLDNASVSSFFYKQATRGLLTVKDVQFSCAQEVKDRQFFIYDTVGHKQYFLNVYFEEVEKPFNYAEDSYFQASSYINIQFRGSGTFHTASASPLKGTLIILDNVRHDGNVPDNTEKVVCDLSGIRRVHAPNLLIEGALPATGWTVLKLDAGETSFGINIEGAGTFDGFWSEWIGDAPAADVSINAMTAEFTDPKVNAGFTLDNGALLKLNNFTGPLGSGRALESFFTFTDIHSRAIVEASYTRDSALNTVPDQLVIRDCKRIRDSAGNSASVAIPMSETSENILYEWQGGLVQSNSRVTHEAISAYASLRSIETNATYGRIQRLNRNGKNYPKPVWRVELTAEMIGQPLHLSMFANFPVRNGGTYLQMNASWDGGTWAGNTNIIEPTQDSWEWHHFSINIPALATYVVFTPITNSDNVTNDLLIAALRISSGRESMPYLLPHYPLQTVSYGSAAPATGTWAVGDKVYDTTPSASGTMGWVCITAGSPGTWKTFGAIGA